MKLAIFPNLEGRQNAVLLFLSYILKSKDPQVIYILSEDDLEWMTINLKFLKTLSNLLHQVIQKGNKIKIIHTLKRNFYDMLFMIEAWMPLYVSGAIEPYYYPKPRDGLTRRTLLLAPNTAAVVSTSIGEHTDNYANFLFTEKKVISEHIKEFNNYLSHCRPLMKFFSKNNTEDYFNTLHNFENSNSNGIIKSSAISSYTLPETLVSDLAESMVKSKKDEYIMIQQKRVKSFIKYLEKNTLTEIITLPEINDVLENKIKLPFLNPFSSHYYYYTPVEFINHLKQALKFLKKYKNYNIIVDQQNDVKDAIIFIKQDVGMIFFKSVQPSFLSYLDETNFISSFWDYMYLKTDPFEDSEQKRQNAIEKIQSYINKLKKHIK